MEVRSSIAEARVAFVTMDTKVHLASRSIVAVCGDSVFVFGLPGMHGSTSAGAQWGSEEIGPTSSNSCFN